MLRVRMCYISVMGRGKAKGRTLVVTPAPTRERQDLEITKSFTPATLSAIESDNPRLPAPTAFRSADGLVTGLITFYPAGPASSASPGIVVIEEWSSEHSGQGNTRKALIELRERYGVVCASGVGYSGSPSYRYWQKMLDEGLIQEATDDDGTLLVRTPTTSVSL